MPRVPRLTTQQVAPSALPNIQTNAAAQPGAGLVAGVTSVVQEFAKVAEEGRVRASRIRLNQAEVEARNLRSRILLDPKDGILNRQRQSAFDAPEQADERWRQGVDKIAAGLTDPEVREAFLGRAAEIRADIQERTFQHVRREMDVVSKETSTALRNDLLNEIVEEPANEWRVGKSLSRALKTERELLTEQGITGEAQDRAIAELQGSAQAARVQALVRRGSVSVARATFDAAKEQMTPTQREDAEKVLRVAEEGQTAEVEASRILATTSSPTERNALITALPIGVRKSVRALVDAEESAAKSARDDEQETAFTAVEQAVVSGVALSDPRLAPQLAKLSTAQRRTLETYTTAPVNDNKAWLDWYQLSSDPKNLATMSESTFRSHWSRLSTSHRDDAERAYRAAKQTANAPESARSYITPQTMIARGMRSVGGIAPFAPLSQIPEEKQPIVAAFETRAAEELGAESQAKGRDLTPTEMQQVIDRMRLTFVRETAVDPVRFGGLEYGTRRTRREETQAFQMSPSDTTGIFAGSTRIRLSEIPADAIGSVDNILRANNIALTDANREALYTIQRFDLDGSRQTRWLNQNRR